MREDCGHRLFYAKAQCQVWLRAKQSEYIMQRELHASCAWVQLNSDTAVYEHWEQILIVKRLKECVCLGAVNWYVLEFEGFGHQ